MPLLLFALGCKNAENYSREGLKHLEAGRDVTALTFFEKALKDDSEYPLALYGKGRLLLQRNITRNDGKAMIEKALPKIEDTPVKEKAYVIIADVYNKEDNLTKAIDYLERAKKEKVTSVRLFNNLAQYYLQINEKEKAEALLKESTALYPASADSFYNLGVFYAIEQKEHEKAYQAFQKANELKPNQKDTLFNLMKAAYLVDKKEEALGHLEKVLPLISNPIEREKVRVLKPLIESGKWKLKD